jgi:hypothetical protein
VAILAPPATPPGKAARCGPPPGAQAAPPPGAQDSVTQRSLPSHGAQADPHGAQADQHGARDAIATRARAVASWLTAVRFRLGDHVFAMNDSEASWRHWQVTKVRGGLGRHYRDPLFDSLGY